MSTGPIDFDEEGARETGYGTEFGGVDGLIQPEVAPGAGTAKNPLEGHALSETEKSRIAARRAMDPLSGRAAWTGEPDTEQIFDPHTGREVDVADLEDVTGTGGTPSDLKP